MLIPNAQSRSKVKNTGARSCSTAHLRSQTRKIIGFRMRHPVKRRRTTFLSRLPARRRIKTGVAKQSNSTFEASTPKATKYAMHLTKKTSKQPVRVLPHISTSWGISMVIAPEIPSWSDKSTSYQMRLSCPSISSGARMPKPHRMKKTILKI